MNSQVTQEQIDKVDELHTQGYTWDKEWSTSAAGVIMKKGDDFYFFGLDGSIMHNPQAFIRISTDQSPIKQ